MFQCCSDNESLEYKKSPQEFSSKVCDLFSLQLALTLDKANTKTAISFFHHLLFVIEHNHVIMYHEYEMKNFWPWTSIGSFQPHHMGHCSYQKQEKSFLEYLGHFLALKRGSGYTHSTKIIILYRKRPPKLIQMP